MGELAADYLVVGAGASGMAFVDSLVSNCDASVVIVDRRHRAGGHWLDAYPFVRLHQAAANYGVASRPLGSDSIETLGPNAGCYELSTGAEICDYFSRVMDDLIRSGRVSFLAMSDYLGVDGEAHQVRSLLTGASTTVRAGTLVDATYVQSEIPSRRPPAYEVDADVRCIPPNDLVDLAEAASAFTIVGAGKTAMDSCGWLLDNGVDPDRIRWIRPRDAYLFNRAALQPLDLVASFMQMQGHMMQAAATAETGVEFAEQLEAAGVYLRIDTSTPAEVFRGASLTRAEVNRLATIQRVVRSGTVRRISSDRVTMSAGEIAGSPGEVYVDCTAAGVRPTTTMPIFADDRITLQYVTFGIVPWGAATIGMVEAVRDDIAEKNRLCPPLTFTGRTVDGLALAYAAVSGIAARGAEPDVGSWNDQCRLNPAMAAPQHPDDPDIMAAYEVIGANFMAALENLSRHVGDLATTS